MAKESEQQDQKEDTQLSKSREVLEDMQTLLFEKHNLPLFMAVGILDKMKMQTRTRAEHVLWSEISEEEDENHENPAKTPNYIS